MWKALSTRRRPFSVIVKTNCETDGLSTALFLAGLAVLQWDNWRCGWLQSSVTIVTMTSGVTTASQPPATARRCRQLYGYPDIEPHDRAAPLATDPTIQQICLFSRGRCRAPCNYKVPPAAQPLHRAASWLVTGPGLNVNTGGSCDYSDVVQQTLITICLSVLHTHSQADPLVLHQCFEPLPWLGVPDSQNLCFPQVPSCSISMLSATFTLNIIFLTQYHFCFLQTDIHSISFWNRDASDWWIDTYYRVPINYRLKVYGSEGH